MNCTEFTDLLATTKIGDEIEFAAYSYNTYDPTPEDCEAWYFAKNMKLDDYDSHFILIDYCGGEEAFAIPLNNYEETCDEDDKMVLKHYVKTFFDMCDNIKKYVYVEINEER